MSRATRLSNLKLSAFMLFAFALIAGGFYLTKGLYGPFIRPAEYKGASILLITWDPVTSEQSFELPLTQIYQGNGYQTARFLLKDDRSFEEPERWLRENSANRFFLSIQDSRNEAAIKNDTPNQSLEEFLKKLNGIHSLEQSIFVVATGSIVYIRTPDGKDISMKEVNRADLPPTILELTGMPIPANMNGKSLIPKINRRD
jgi:hypothetical protein